MSKKLIIAIGNSGREDDGLGWAFLDEISSKLDDLTDVEYKYQLQIEDADLIKDYSSVLFVDADRRQYNKGYDLYKIIPKDIASYTSHELSVESVLNLCQSIYNKEPLCYVLGISGESFNLKVGLTKKASNNLKKVIKNFDEILLESSL